MDKNIILELEKIIKKRKKAPIHPPTFLIFLAKEKLK